MILSRQMQQHAAIRSQLCPKYASKAVWACIQQCTDMLHLVVQHIAKFWCGKIFCAQHTLMLGMRGVRLQNTGGTETIEDVLGIQLDICSTDPCNSQI